MNIRHDVYWRLFLTSNKESFVQRSIEQIEIHFGTIKVTKKDIYWKDPLLYEIEFLQEIEFHGLGELICQLMIKATLLSNHWEFIFPNDVCNNYLEISGIAHKTTKINGVKWASFCLA
jgi:hypothetical protein